MRDKPGTGQLERDAGQAGCQQDQTQEQRYAPPPVQLESSRNGRRPDRAYESTYAQGEPRKMDGPSDAEYPS